MYAKSKGPFSLFFLEFHFHSHVMMALVYRLVYKIVKQTDFTHSGANYVAVKLKESLTLACNQQLWVKGLSVLALPSQIAIERGQWYKAVQQ